MKTLERTSTRSEKRNFRPLGRLLADLHGIVLTPYDILDSRVRAAMRSASARMLSDGSYRATTPAVAPIYGSGTSRRAALDDLRESCRWLLADPVRLPFEAEGKTYTAEVLAERYGGYSATVPEIPGCFTSGATMDDVRRNVVEAAELMLEVPA